MSRSSCWAAAEVEYPRDGRTAAETGSCARAAMGSAANMIASAAKARAVAVRLVRSLRPRHARTLMPTTMPTPIAPTTMEVRTSESTKLRERSASSNAARWTTSSTGTRTKTNTASASAPRRIARVQGRQRPSIRATACASAESAAAAWRTMTPCRTAWRMIGRTPAAAVGRASAAAWPIPARTTSAMAVATSPTTESKRDARSGPLTAGSERGSQRSPGRLRGLTFTSDRWSQANTATMTTTARTAAPSAVSSVSLRRSPARNSA